LKRTFFPYSRAKHPAFFATILFFHIVLFFEMRMRRRSHPIAGGFLLFHGLMGLFRAAGCTPAAFLSL